MTASPVVGYEWIFLPIALRSIFSFIANETSLMISPARSATIVAPRISPVFLRTVILQKPTFELSRIAVVARS